ncbi:MAG: HAD hydrolase family protein, partial [Neisseria sp.]|nr:HAD hydrolase family protein [Neisseria sp.]
GVCEQGIWVSRESEGLLQAMRDLGIAYIPQMRADRRAPVYQMLAFYPESRAAEIEPGLPRNIKTVRWHREAVDLLDKAGSKARGIQTVLDTLGLTMADAMAFGDGLNDREMLGAVGFGVAMGNAEAELKAVADYIAPAAADDGIYRALCDLGVIEAV